MPSAQEMQEWSMSQLERVMERWMVPGMLVIAAVGCLLLGFAAALDNAWLVVLVLYSTAALLAALTTPPTRRGSARPSLNTPAGR